MLWYLHLCAAAGVVVTGYSDAAVATMAEDAGGGGRFTEAVLRPHVTVSSPDMIEKANGLHREAHEKCFIARSVNFPVRHEPVVVARPARSPRPVSGARLRARGARPSPWGR